MVSCLAWPWAPKKHRRTFWAPLFCHCLQNRRLTTAPHTVAPHRAFQADCRFSSQTLCKTLLSSELSYSYLCLHTPENRGHLCAPLPPASQVSQEGGEEVQEWGGSRPVIRNPSYPSRWAMGTICVHSGWRIKPIFLLRALTLSGTK